MSIQLVEVTLPFAGIVSTDVTVITGLPGAPGADGENGTGSIISATAPEDTSLRWIDPTDGVEAYYIGGGWVTQQTTYTVAEVIPEDVIAPTLSTPTATATGTTTVSGTITTTEAGGTVYAHIATSAPSTATIKASGSSVAGGSPGVKTFIFTGRTPATLYSVYYVHTDAAGNDSDVANAAVTTDVVSGPASITVSGTNESPDATSFRVETDIIGGSESWVAIGSFAAPAYLAAFSETLAGFEYNSGYNIRIVPVNPTGDGPHYPSVAVWTRPQFAPVASVVNTSIGVQTLSWTLATDPANGGFNIYRNGTLIETVGAADRTYISTGLDYSTAYSYVVVAFNLTHGGSSVSPDSNTASATTAESPYYAALDFDGDDDMTGVELNAPATIVPVTVWTGDSLYIEGVGSLVVSYTPRDYQSLFLAGIFVPGYRMVVATGFAYIYINGDELKILSPGLFATLATQSIATGLGNGVEAVRYFWIEHQVTVGVVNGWVRCTISASPTRPVSDSTNSIYLSDAGFTAQMDDIYIPAQCTVDHIRLSDTLIGSSPL